MSRACNLTVALIALSPLLGFSVSASAAPAKLTAAQIVDKNIAARGGLEKWRAVQTLSWSGKLDAGGGNEPTLNLKIPGMPPAPPPSQKPAGQAQLPFVLEMKRGRKSRLEIIFNGETAVQAYDGTQGWKLRPFLNRHEVEPFTAAELEVAASQSDLDGTLVDYAAKGTKVELESVEQVEGRDAYKLKLTLKNQRVLREWIDAQTFLEVKIEGTPRKLDGKPHSVSIFMRDYRNVNGLQIPHLLETVVQGVKRTEKIEIEKVVVNARLDESRFSKPT
ncbi:MAG: outer membrane lipoprotein-sorting protein [Steroidobacteraceae bacterium]